MAKIQKYVEFYFPGSLFPEVRREEVKHNSFRDIYRNLPGGAFAFAFNTIETIEVEFCNGVKRSISESVDKSEMFYPDGRIWTINEIRDKDPDSMLYRNMKINDWTAVVETKRGNFQPLNDGDVVFGENYCFTYKK